MFVRVIQRFHCFSSSSTVMVGGGGGGLDGGASRQQVICITAHVNSTYSNPNNSYARRCRQQRANEHTIQTNASNTHTTRKCSNRNNETQRRKKNETKIAKLESHTFVVVIYFRKTNLIWSAFMASTMAKVEAPATYRAAGNGCARNFRVRNG